VNTPNGVYIVPESSWGSLNREVHEFSTGNASIKIDFRVCVDFYIHLKFIKIYYIPRTVRRVLQFFTFSFLILTISLRIFMLVSQSCVCSAIAEHFSKRLRFHCYNLLSDYNRVFCFFHIDLPAFPESHFIIIKKKKVIFLHFAFPISRLCNRSSINIDIVLCR